MPDASTQTDPIRKKLVKVAVAPVVETQTAAGLGPTRKAISETTKTKYEQAIKRIRDAGLDMGNDENDDVSKVIAWVKSKGGDSAQKTYYSAIKWELGKLDKPNYFPRAYQAEIDRLYGLANKKADDQELTEKQVSNFLPYTDLLAVQQRLQHLSWQGRPQPSYLPHAKLFLQQNVQSLKSLRHHASQIALHQPQINPAQSTQMECLSS